MKTILKIIGIIILILIVTSIIVLKILSSRPAVPNDYQQKTETGGSIEAKYIANGPHEVSMHEDVTLLDFGKFSVYYPKELESSRKKYPVIVICNGSGTPLSKYPAIAKHYASWGFIVVGTEWDAVEWNGMCSK